MPLHADGLSASGNRSGNCSRNHSRSCRWDGEGIEHRSRNCSRRIPEPWSSNVVPAICSTRQRHCSRRRQRPLPVVPATRSRGVGVSPRCLPRPGSARLGLDELPAAELLVRLELRLQVLRLRDRQVHTGRVGPPKLRLTTAKWWRQHHWRRRWCFRFLPSSFWRNRRNPSARLRLDATGRSLRWTLRSGSS